MEYNKKGGEKYTKGEENVSKLTSLPFPGVARQCRIIVKQTPVYPSLRSRWYRKVPLHQGFYNSSDEMTEFIHCHICRSCPYPIFIYSPDNISLSLHFLLSSRPSVLAFSDSKTNPLCNGLRSCNTHPHCK